MVLRGSPISFMKVFGIYQSLPNRPDKPAKTFFNGFAAPDCPCLEQILVISVSVENPKAVLLN